MTATRLAFTNLLAAGLLAAGACTPGRDAPVAPARRPTLAESDDVYRERVRRRLESAADGLLYTSESDYPFAYHFRAASVEGPLTEDAFRALEGVPATEPVEERTLDDFFARHIEHVDPADAVALSLVPEYERLKRTLARELENPRVFRAGTIAIRCYIVGTDRDGNVVGLTTTAIET